jgi:WD40 repeat protein
MKILKHLFSVVIQVYYIKVHLIQYHLFNLVSESVFLEIQFKYRCVLIEEEGLADMSVPPKNPIIMTYQAHDSPVYSVNFSPFHRHLFLTSAHDGQIRIYSQLFVSKIFQKSFCRR